MIRYILPLIAVIAVPAASQLTATLPGRGAPAPVSGTVWTIQAYDALGRATTQQPRSTSNQVTAQAWAIEEYDALLRLVGRSAADRAALIADARKRLQLRALMGEHDATWFLIAEEARAPDGVMLGKAAYIRITATRTP